MDLAALVEKSVGKNDEKQKTSIFLDTGFPPLNKAISGSYDGGMPVGDIVEMFGPPSCGKTAIATRCMAAAQQAGGIAVFMDHENSFDVELGQQLGLDVTPGRWVYKQPMTFEESIDMATHLANAVRDAGAIDEKAPIIVVFDSLASMVPQSKMFDSKGKRRDSDSYNMHDNTALARCTSACFPALKVEAKRLNMTLLFLNQTRQKPGVAYGDPTTTPGGNAPEFYSGVRIKLSRKILKNKTTNEFEGQIITSECVKNKISMPFKKAEWRFVFREDGSGHFDVITSTLEYLKSTGAIETAGAYVVWTDDKKYHLGPLAEKIESEGLEDELFSLLK